MSLPPPRRTTCDFAVILDPTMVQNILKTDVHESRDLMSWIGGGNVVLWSALPVAFSGGCALRIVRCPATR